MKDYGWIWWVAGGAVALYLLSGSRRSEAPPRLVTAPVPPPQAPPPAPPGGYTPPVTVPFAISRAPRQMGVPAPAGACVLVAAEPHVIVSDPDLGVVHGTVAAGATLYVVERRSVSGLEVYRVDPSSPGLGGVAAGWFSPVPSERLVCS